MDSNDIRIIKEIASPSGAMAYAPDRASMPVEGDDTGLTYGAYFEALEAFVSGEGFAPLTRALVASGRPDGLAGAMEIVLRAEKHGALYHPASCTVRFDGDAAKFCVNVAASEMGLGCLEVEAGLLETLRARFTPEFLPCPYAYGRVAGLGLLLEEWFAGYHEFHQDGSGRVRLWDFDAGERVLTQGEAAALYGEAARILTRYYDAETGASIGPWHHGAGDFVARVSDGTVSARLITVRGHGASRSFTEAGPMAERLAGLSFFTNMTMRARLDRVNGVGELVLADAAVVPALVSGFAAALGERPDCGDAGLGLLDFLGSFSAEELAGAGAQLMEPCPPQEQALLAAAWPEHAAALVAALGGL
ncbi:hypothetical protein [Solidesulfovibrio sp. C21]|uniref:hypothetical protein n=1 Tax=Solidesulfovibrio sp. C21 TaxID=3398613 RepID=UPI0039FC2576